MRFPVPDVRRPRRLLSRAAVLAATAALLVPPMPAAAAGISFRPVYEVNGWTPYPAVSIDLDIDVDGSVAQSDRVDGAIDEYLKKVDCTGNISSGALPFGLYHEDQSGWLVISTQGVNEIQCTAIYLRRTWSCPTEFDCTVSDFREETSPVFSKTVRLDSERPIVLQGVPRSQPNAAGWYRTFGAVDFVGSDYASGIEFCSTGLPFGGVSSASRQYVEGTCWDKVGNRAIGWFWPYSFDNTAPTLSPTVSPSIVPLGGVATAAPNATDAHSGVKSQSCDPVDTSTPGVHTVSCTATDNADNTTTSTATYSVGYTFSGFSQPVDTNARNVANSGKTIPLKWRVTDASGAPVTNLTSVSVTAASLSCAAGATEDQIEEYASGNSGLQNLGNGYYQFNWSTPKSYAKSCKTLRLDLGDGIARTASFEFGK